MALGRGDDERPLSPPVATPLLAFAVASESARDRVLGALTGHRRLVEVATGMTVVVVSLYYLLVVFAVLGPVS